MIDVIKDELSEYELYNNFKCKKCVNLESCYLETSSKLNREHAESLNFGGYDSEEEFYDNL